MNRSGRERVWGETGWQDGAETCSAGRGASQITAASRISAQTRLTAPSPGPAAGKRSRVSPGARLLTQALHCGIRRETTKFSSLRCEKRQALICKARRPYQEPSYLQGSRALSKGSRRCLYVFHFPACHILYLLFISVKPQNKTDGLLLETWTC